MKNIKNNTQIQVLLIMGLLMPIILITTQSVSIKWLMYGPLTWLIALLFKTFVFGSIQYVIGLYSKNKLLLSILWGMQSALAELGTTIYFFNRFWNELNIQNVLSFGIGIGLIEIFYIIGTVFLDKNNKEEDIKNKRFEWFVSWSGVFERIYTLMGHVFSRGIIWIGMSTKSNYFLVLIAFVLFSIVDCIALYAVDNDWDFSDSVISKKFHLSMFMITIIEGILFILLLN